ncbi:MAG: tetratricopeptide repeat protein [Candidatus Thorarchaeota archaeon]
MELDVDEALSRASALCDEECDDDAERVLLEALEKHPNNLDLRTMLGKVQSRLHREEEAEITLRGVLEKDPLHEDASCALGRLLDQSLRSDEAEQVYRELLKESPSSHCALDDLCRLLLAEGRPLEALDVARGHSDRFPDHIEAYDGLRYVLAVIEDELSEGYISESTSDETLVRLVANMLEQYKVILKMEHNIDSFSALPENVSYDLENDYLRIVGELEHLSEIINDRGINLPSLLANQLSASVKEGSSRRERI